VSFPVDISSKRFGYSLRDFFEEASTIYLNHRFRPNVAQLTETRASSTGRINRLPKCSGQKS
jgi:hypothetical protein